MIQLDFQAIRKKFVGWLSSYINIPPSNFFQKYAIKIATNHHQKCQSSNSSLSCMYADKFPKSEIEITSFLNKWGMVAKKLREKMLRK